MTEGASDEVDCHPEAPCSFTRLASPTFDALRLRELLQHLLLRRDEAVVFDCDRVEAWLAKLLSQIAVVVGMTYAECGDSARLTDDEALMLIRELLLEVDADMIERHKGEKLPRHFSRLLSCL